MPLPEPPRNETDLGGPLPPQVKTMCPRTSGCACTTPTERVLGGSRGSGGPADLGGRAGRAQPPEDLAIDPAHNLAGI